MSSNGIAVAASWSGGKDSCLALHRAVTAGAVPRALLTMFDETGARSRSHGLRPEVVAAQAAQLGVRLHTARATWTAYEAEFVRSLHALREQGIGEVVFGDIDLEAHREWEERVCAAAGLRARLPLWRADRHALLTEFWRAGFRCHLVAVDAAKLGPEVLGAELSPQLVEQFERRGIDACGENGEFHTVVTAGPLFAKPLALTFGEIVQRAGCLAIDVSCRA